MSYYPSVRRFDRTSMIIGIFVGILIGCVAMAVLFSP